MKNFEFEPLPEVKSRKEEIAKKSEQTIGRMATTRMCVDMPENLVEKIKDYAYWDGFTQQEIILQAVNELMANKHIKARPETVKNRPKPGRKPNR